jgi:hypothetical protein
VVDHFDGQLAVANVSRRLEMYFVGYHELREHRLLIEVTSTMPERY